MKKSVLLLATLMFLVTFSSCFKDKEGEYKPKEKIARVFYDEGYGDGKSLTEMWHWGDKQLQSIEHYDDGDLDFTEEFTYNKKGQIERIDCYAYSESIEYKYDDKNKLSKMTYYDGNSIELEFTFKHDGDKVSKIEFMEFGKGESKSRLMAEGINPLSLIMPQDAAAEIMKTFIKKQAETKSDMITMDLAWEKDNVKSIKVYIGSYVFSYTMEYDDKLNPYTGFYNSAYCMENIVYPEDYGYGGGFFIYSKNNITTMKYVDSDGDAETMRYSYTYEGKYPSVKRYNYTYEELVDMYYDYETGEYVYVYEDVTRTKSTYYEYE